MRKVNRKYLINVSIIGIVTITIFVIWMLKARPQQPNVILIVLDTVRADHIGFYGRSPSITPNIDSFIKSSLAFENAYAPERSTPLSHMTMFTGLYPTTHKVDGNERGLDRKIPTLAEILKNEGYLTLGYTGFITLLAPKFGFGKGFDFYINGNYGVDQHKVSAKVETKTILNQLNLIDRKKSIFLFINYFDAHADYFKMPYDAPIQYQNQLCPEREKPFTGKFGPNYGSKGLRYANKHSVEVSKEDIDYITCLYDSGLAYLDHWIGVFLKNLKEKNLFDNSLIILTSDHGEEFREHGFFTHENPFMHEGLVKVLLAIKLPNSNKHHVFSTIVGLVDLLPTIMDYLEIDKKLFLQGKSILSLLQSKTEEDRIAYGMGFWGVAFVREGRWKLTVQKIDSSNPDYQLFDLSSDPGETHNLSHINQSKFSELKLRLAKEYQKAKSVKFKSTPQRLTPEEFENLKSLGYL